MSPAVIKMDCTTRQRSPSLDVMPDHTPRNAVIQPGLGSIVWISDPAGRDVHPARQSATDGV